MRSAPTLTLSTELLEGLSPDEAVCRARAGLRGGDIGNRVAAFYLADLVDRRRYVDLTYTSLRDFARRGLREPESTIRKLVDVGRLLRSLPIIDEFLAAGRITWTQVKDLVRIATPETERAWAEWAEKHSTRQLAALIGRREKGDLPTAPDRRRIHQPTVRVGANLSGTYSRIWELARAKLEAQYGAPLTDRDMMMHVAQLILRQRPDGTVPGWTQVNDRHYLLHAYPRALGSDELVTVGEEREEVPIDPVELTASLARPSNRSPALSQLAAATTIDLAMIDPDNHGPLVPEALRDVPTDESLRKEILQRDGYSCRRCGSKDNVTVHHRVWRRYGGKTTPSNLLAACEACHSLIHDLRLIVLGDPEGELRFLDGQGRPIECPPAQPVDFRIVPVGVAAEPRTSSAQVELDGLPAEVDVDWWKRHEHLLSWHERSSELVLASGVARELPGEPAPAQATAAPRLSALVGQTALRERLEVSIGAARLRGEQPGHLLFAGTPGLGKTSFARAVAAELEAPLTMVAAPHLRTPDGLVRALVGVPDRGVLFLDELHALPARAAEALYEAIDTGVLSLPVRQGSRARVLRIRLRPFTLIGATTELDQLTRPLLSRLDLLRLEPYSTEELAAIVVDRAAREHGLELEPEGAARLALASRDTPRRALALLRAVRDEATVAQVAVADVAVVERALTRQGVDGQGLDRLDRSYLRLLESTRQPVGLGTLAAQLDVPEETLRTVVEPPLVRRGLVRITPAGRVRGALAAA